MGEFLAEARISLGILLSWQALAALGGFFLLAAVIRFIAVGSAPRPPIHLSLPISKKAKETKEQKPQAAEGEGEGEAVEEDENPSLEEESYPVGKD